MITPAKADASPTLADDQSVLFATAGKLEKSYALGSTAEVAAAPVIRNGVIYVVSADGMLTITEPSGLKGYGNAYWARYRHDNFGNGALSK